MIFHCVLTYKTLDFKNSVQIYSFLLHLKVTISWNQLLEPVFTQELNTFFNILDVGTSD